MVQIFCKSLSTSAHMHLSISDVRERNVPHLHRKKCPAFSAFVLQPIMGTFLMGNEKTEGLNCRPQKCSNCATLEFCENAKFGESRPDSAQSAEIPQNPAKCKSAGQFCINPTLHPISSILRHSFRQGAGGSLAITRPEKSSRKKRDPDRSPSTGQLFSRTVPAFSLFGLVSLKIWGHFPEFSISSRRKWFHSR